MVATATQPSVTAGMAVLAATIPQPACALTAAQLASASVGATIPPPVCALIVRPVRPATLAVTVPAPVCSLFAAQLVEAVVAATVPPPSCALFATQAASASLIALIPPPTCTLIAGQAAAATLAVTLPAPAGALVVLPVRSAVIAVTIPPPLCTLSAAADTGTGMPDPNWLARISLPGVVMAEDWSGLNSVTDYMWQNGTYNAHPNYAVRETDPAIVAPGHTACLKIVIPADGGEVDTTSSTAWALGVNYAFEQCVTRQLSHCRSAH